MRRRWTALVVVAMFASMVVQTQEARATTTDYMLTANGASVNSSDFTSSSNVGDGNPATFATLNTSAGFCNAYGNSYAPWHRVNLSATATITQVHVKASYPCIGSGGTNASGIEFICGSGGSSWTKTILVTSASFDLDFDLSTGGTGYAGGCTGGTTTPVQMRFWSGGDGTTIKVYEARAYDSAQPVLVGFENYCANTLVEHPPFHWKGSCVWAKDWHGTLTFTSSSAAGSIHTGMDPSTEYNPTAAYTRSAGTWIRGTPMWWEQNCFPLCESQYVTVTIEDTSEVPTQIATFTFDRSTDGLQQTETVRPFFTQWAGCFNKTTDLCGHGSTAGTTDIWYTFTGSHAQVYIGPRNTTGQIYVNRYTGGEDPGDHTHYGLTTDTSQANVWLVKATNAINPNGLWVEIRLDFESSTAVVSQGSQVEPDQSDYLCPELDLGCRIAGIFGVVADDFIELVAGGVDELRELAMTRQPFAFIIRGYDGVSEQVVRALESVDDSDDCAGLGLQLPELPTISFTFVGHTYGGETWPDGLERPTFYALRCADLEPIFGSDEWQAIRGALDPALWLANAFFWLRKLQPRPSVNG